MKRILLYSLIILSLLSSLIAGLSCTTAKPSLSYSPTPSQTMSQGYTPGGQQSAQVQPLPSSIISGDYSIACTRVDRNPSGLNFYGTTWLAIRRIKVSSNPKPSTDIKLYDDHGNVYGTRFTVWSGATNYDQLWPTGGFGTGSVDCDKVPLGFTWIAQVGLAEQIPTVAPLIRWSVGGTSAAFEPLGSYVQLLPLRPETLISLGDTKVYDQWTSVTLAEVKVQGTAIQVRVRFENKDYNTLQRGMIFGLWLPDGTITWLQGYFAGKYQYEKAALYVEIPGSSASEAWFQFREGATLNPRAILIIISGNLYVYNMG